MANIHDLAREFLAGEGVKMSSTQSRAIFLFVDWLLAKQRAAQHRMHLTGGTVAPVESDPVYEFSPLAKSILATRK